MRVTVPQIHSSIIRSPTTRILRPRARSKSVRAIREQGSDERHGMPSVEDQPLLDQIADDVRHDLMHFLHDRGVAVGTDQRRSAISATRPPPLPVNATVTAPRFFAASSASTTLRDVPLVVMPITTSPGCANAST